jgi:phage terminase large subunit GpA-like protein
LNDFADIEIVLGTAMRAWRPPPRLTLSDWAERHFFLSAESAAEPGRWKTIPYQRGIMNAVTDPAIEQISVMKSARVGYTKVINAAVGYHLHQAPCPILVVQPTVDDAKGYSKEEIAPMLRDCPDLAKIVFEDSEESGPKDSGNTILHKQFPGGVLSMIGANSGSGFRRISRKLVVFDEVDAYPPSAGSDGDQIKLGIKRSEYYWDRKILAGSTPLIAGASRIERLFESGDQRRYYVPCPQCGHLASLVFSGDAGHRMTFDVARPAEAFFTCQENGCAIEHRDKRAMIEAGEWRASAPFTGHASFHIWAAYSYSPNATWGHIAAEFLDAKQNSETLKTFVNTVLGETWKDRGDAPDWERLYQRRDDYLSGTVPPGVLFLTAGVDVQKDRWVYEVVGWGAGKESWSVDSGVLLGDTSNEASWSKLDALLDRSFVTSTGVPMSILCMGVDSGFQTNTVYNWARRHPMSRVIALKGVAGARTLLGTPTPVDVTVRGKRISRGYKVWTIGVDVAKSELYGWLGLAPPERGAPFPPGFCHFPELSEDYFKQLTAEHLVASVTRQGFTKLEWQLIPGRENHVLDCRIYARGAAALVGLDRLKMPTASSASAARPIEEPKTEPSRTRARPPGSFLQRRGSIGRDAGKGWLR